METARYMRYILIGNRKILVEEPTGDKYRSATEDIAVGQSVEGIRTEECVFAITNDGLFIGSSVGVESHITPSKFAEATSGIYTPHSVIGHAYITRLPSVKSGMSTHNSAKGLVTAAKLGRAESGVITTHEAKGRTTHSRLTEAKEGIGAESKAETFYTTEPKFAEGISGMGADSNIEAKTTEAKLSKVQSGASAGQSAKGTITSPTQDTIYAGTYVGNSQTTAIVLFEVYIPISYGYGGYPSVASRITLDEYGNITAWRDQEDGDAIGIVDARGVILGTDNEEFSVTSDTGVTAEEYATFMAYFKPTTAVIPAGTYEGVDAAIDPTVLPSNLSITLPLSYSVDSTPLTASYLGIGSDEVSMSALGVRSYDPEDLDLLGWAFIGGGWVFGLATDNGTITVTANTTVPIEQYDLFYTLFKPTN